MSENKKKQKLRVSEKFQKENKKEGKYQRSTSKRKAQSCEGQASKKWKSERKLKEIHQDSVKSKR